MTQLLQQILPIASAMLLAAASVLPAFAQGDCPTSVSGRSYYVSPGGGGSACTSASPCSLTTGLSNAGAGDDVVLKNGRYSGLRTRGGGSPGRLLLIRAENRHQAVIEWSSNSPAVDIRHSNIILRDLKIDGMRRSKDNVRVMGDAGSTSVRNVIIESNWVTNGGHAGIFLGSVANVIIRHNLVENTGFIGEGESLYLSSAQSNRPVRNTEVYGNVFRNMTLNLVDYKSQTLGANIHHNIFENHRRNWQGHGGDGLVRSVGSNSGPGNYFQDNIVRNAPHVRYTIRLTSNRVDVLNNVFSNTGGNSFITSPSNPLAIIRGNTLCNSPASGANSRPNWRPNRINQPLSVCQEESRRIQNEMSHLPRCGEIPDWSDLPPVAEERPDPDKVDWTTILGPVAVGGAAATILPNVLPETEKIGGIREFLGAIDSG